MWTESDPACSAFPDGPDRPDGPAGPEPRGTSHDAESRSAHGTTARPETSDADALARLKDAHPVRAGLVGESPALRVLFERVLALARSDVPVLIQGETGSGKENVAEAIHLNSERSAAPFVVVTGASLADGFHAQRLFGHARGAFTGASASVPGLLERADGGTLFLDEVADIPAAAQATLVRVLQTGEFRALGSPELRRSDFRLIAATRRDLRALVASGLLRGDLYFRLRGAIVDVPPLRERRADVLPLVDAVLRDWRNTTRTTPPRLTDDARRALLEHDWPGNVLELRQELRQAITIARDGAITPGCFQFVADPPPREWPAQPVPVRLRETLGAAEAASIRDALQASNGNKAEAARRLGLTRRSFYRRLETMRREADETRRPGADETRSAPPEGAPSGH